jgi:hypothetical protein
MGSLEKLDSCRQMKSSYIENNKKRISLIKLDKLIKEPESKAILPYNKFVSLDKINTHRSIESRARPCNKTLFVQHQNQDLDSTASVLPKAKLPINMKLAPVVLENIHDPVAKDNIHD